MITESESPEKGKSPEKGTSWWEFYPGMVKAQQDIALIFKDDGYYSDRFKAFRDYVELRHALSFPKDTRDYRYMVMDIKENIGIGNRVSTEYKQTFSAMPDTINGLIAPFLPELSTHHSDIPADKAVAMILMDIKDQLKDEKMRLLKK